MQGPTWQQAVQWLQERRVQPGDILEASAKHDTYSISFALADGKDPDAMAASANGSSDGVASSRTPVPLKVSSADCRQPFCPCQGSTARTDPLRASALPRVGRRPVPEGSPHAVGILLVFQAHL